MNNCAIQQNSYAACEEIWASAAAMGRSAEKDTVVCPKPRRLGRIHAALEPSYARALRWHIRHQQEDCDAEAGNELLDIILAKGVSEQSTADAPFFCGSPPSRVSNPLIQDARFGDDNGNPVIPMAPSPHKGGCVRASFESNPAVRIEGFDCLDRDRRNRSIPALV